MEYSKYEVRVFKSLSTSENTESLNRFLNIMGTSVMVITPILIDKEKLEKLDRINKPKCNLCNGTGFYYEESGDTLKHYECNCQGTKTF